MKIVDFRAVRDSRAALDLLSQNAVEDETGDTEFGSSNGLRDAKRDIFRSILLLELAAERVRDLVMQISDPQLKHICEAQFATIEKLLQTVRLEALKL